MFRRVPVLQGPYRAGPWPGLTPNGAIVLLACAAMLAAEQLLIGAPSLPLLGITTLLPLALATRVVQTPGAASAVSGAYLMPRALLSVVYPELAVPPLLLVPAVAFDLTLWVRRADFNWRRRRRRKKPRTLTWSGTLIAGAVFGLVLAVVEPAFELFIGAPSSGESLLAALVTIALCSVVGLVSVPDRAS